MMKKFYYYFDLNRFERRGFLTLCIILFLTICIPVFYSNLSKPLLPTYRIDTLEFNPHIEFSSYETKEDADYSRVEYYTTPLSPKSGQLFVFNPNGLSISEWVKLGFSEKQAQVIKNYESKGGKFKSKEDFRKLFVVSEKMYNRLEPYIEISPDDQSITSFKHSISTKKNAVVHNTINLNTADTTTLKQLRGIGDTYSMRIIKFRDALGGFYSKEQLKEVYDNTPELYQSISSMVHTDNQILQKIYVNLHDVSQLKKHPYISSKQASAIVNYRNQHGSYTSVEDLEKVLLLDNIFLRKIEPYLNYSIKQQ